MFLEKFPLPPIHIHRALSSCSANKLIIFLLIIYPPSPAAVTASYVEFNIYIALRGPGRRRDLHSHTRAASAASAADNVS